MPQKWLLIVFNSFLSAFLVGPVAGSESKEAISYTCERVAEEASLRSGVPVSVLKAISLTETGHKLNGKLRPWPWTVNMEGAGHWFDTQDEARAYVFKEFKRGARSFDVGCFQINYKWHNQAFSSIDQMFDPLSNALYAAKFLTELYAETGSWDAAAGAYHSRTKEYADRYTARFSELRRRYLAADDETMPPMMQSARSSFPQNEIPEIPDIVMAMNNPDAPPRAPRINSYPLLRRTAGVVPSSLGHAPSASLFATSLQKTEVE